MARPSNYLRLLNLGFSIEDARKLSSTERTLPDGRVITVKALNLNDPLIMVMIRSRARAAQRARNAGVSRLDFERRTQARLADMGIEDAWGLVRAYEDRYPNLGGSPPSIHREKKPITDKDISRGRRKMASATKITTEQYQYLDGMGLAGSYRPVYEGGRLDHYEKG